MAQQNKAIYYMGGLFFLLVLIDLISTLRFKELIPYLEANPIYSTIGLTGIILLNIFFLWGICLWYIKTTRPTSRFYVIHILLLMNLTRIFVIYNNIEVYKSFSQFSKEEALQIAKSVTKEAKVEHITEIAALQFLPFFVGMLTYWLFLIDHSIHIKEK
tara:strand:+ start:536 stop:1012 length:477 start_codon:yes stop_codon:yes gene_type:complete